MKIILFFLIVSADVCAVYSQNQDYSFDRFRVRLDSSTLNVFDQKGNEIYQKKFNNPSGFSSDLNGDTQNEFMTLDSLIINNRPFYTLYIFNTKDSFYLADSVISGLTVPYLISSEEEGGTIIVSGNPQFDFFNEGTDYFSPINYWKYEENQMLLVNDDVYDLFITENEDLIDYINTYFKDNLKNCQSTQKIKAAIASVYVNYISAGEKSIGNQFLKKYYLCPDLEQFKKSINLIIEKGK